MSVIHYGCADCDDKDRVIDRLKALLVEAVPHLEDHRRVLVLDVDRRKVERFLKSVEEAVS